MIEDAHDAGFAIGGHSHGMKALLVALLLLFHLLYDLLRQPLGNKVRNDHRIGVKPAAVCHFCDRGVQASGQIGTAAKMLAEKTHRLLDAAGGGKFVMHDLVGEQHNVATAVIRQRDAQQRQAKSLGALLIETAHRT
ncbi:hypothetical protein D3C81_837970 [compost metagenome]